MSYKIHSKNPLYQPSKQLLEQLFHITSTAKPSGDTILFDLGIIVFTAMYHHHFGNEQSKIALEDQVETFEEALNNYAVDNPAKQTLVSGYLSFGLVYHFLKKYAKMEASPYFEENLDDIAFAALEFQLDIGNLDFLYGATGILHYMLRYTKDKNIVNKAISLYLTHLQKTKLHLKGGIAWEDYYFRHREDKIGINLGLAHGVPGILKVLLSIYAYAEHAQQKDGIKKIIQGVVSFLKNVVFKQHEIAYSYFYIPDVEQDSSTVDTRLGWCYGDLSNALILYQAGKIIEDDAMIQFANEILQKTCKRKLQSSTKIRDAGLCHGTVGLQHMYQIAYNYTQTTDFLDASQHWLQETFEQCSSFVNEGAYKKFNPIEKKYEVDNGFLEGAAGIGLSLITLLTGDNSWNELLLLNDV
ncbi:lanthionine synthetase-like protein [Kordia periserrulae]|uniref:Lanthionine synthetase-like protein n=1 Tax=Kordia periserrulae TaxID=701523 RepID=A0A2T6C5M9_9FLAO|nr:lanthionine synthetase LanC family protein [Kordia periserrulae]PTX63624.1 lanthionine synthetase-like protein [Kordia periserrulae]